MSLQRKRRSCSCLSFQFPNRQKPWKQSLQTDSKCICNSRHKLVTCYFVILFGKFFWLYSRRLQRISISYLFPQYDIYAAHVLLALNRWPLNLVSTSQSASLFTCSKLVKATIKPKPQAKVNSPYWWHLGWWPYQRWRREKLWAHHRGCLRAGRIPPLNCSNTDEL